jgi:hypothetical protein
MDVQGVVAKMVRAALDNYVPAVVRDLFKRGDGITYITALGTVTSDYVSGKPKVRFDANDAASGMTYPYLASYAPAANDRVLLIKQGHGWVVVGKVMNS